MLQQDGCGRYPFHHRSAPLSPRSSPWVVALCVTALSLAPLTAGVVAAATPEPQQELVVRIAIADAAQLAALSRQVEVWEHGANAAGVLAKVSQAQRAALVAAGWQVEPEAYQTARLPRALGHRALPAATIAGFPCYRTVEETYASLAALAAEQPQLARWIDIGDSWEKLHGPGPGYELRALVLSNRNSPFPKAPLVIEAAIHARELATAELVTRFAEQLVAGYGSDPDVTWILDHVEVHVIPYLNPDGRKRAESGLLWRKNVNNAYCSGTELRGVDLNRNSVVFWGGAGSSGDVCSLVFRGPRATSEPETQALTAYLDQVFDDQRADGSAEAPPDTEGLFLAVHSFGRVILPPFHDPANPAPNRDQLATLARKLGSFNGYRPCPAGPGQASGNSVDLAYSRFGVAAYTLELGTTFFESCPTFEEQVAPRNLPLLLYAAKAARRPYELPLGPEATEVTLSATEVAAGEPVEVRATLDARLYADNGCGRETRQSVRRGLVTVDLPPWEAAIARVLRPADGNGNSEVEGVQATLDTSRLAPGRRLVYVYGQDADSNLGVPTARFLTVRGTTTPRPPGPAGRPGSQAGVNAGPAAPGAGQRPARRQ